MACRVRPHLPSDRPLKLAGLVQGRQSYCAEAPALAASPDASRLGRILRHTKRYEGVLIPMYRTQGARQNLLRPTAASSAFYDRN